ncbi:ATP-binding cassette domain-containing protein [uncultured Clostridium sp.]|uniref:ATP-binding cassette domain-containing protein n=1 Tax=uncultured Clostridium sp. TaxID=59620 RepID=UPI00263710C5|nr:ATP-binding cassette domain-containing protein [uncultured Clostridium sp.]
MNKLIVEDLDFSYGDFKALKNISLEASNGIIALLGPNGAGKSTLMKILVTLLEKESGNINFNGIDYENTEKIRSYIGYLPQKFEAYKNVTGKEFLNFIYDVKGLKINRKEHIGGIISLVNLEEFIDRKINSYSGGVLRRLGIAQALVGDSKLIIIDEPTVGLDPQQRNQFRNILSKISIDKIVIISTHIVEDIEFCSNNLFILNKGEIRYSGSSKNLIERYKKNIWTSIVAREEFDMINSRYEVLSFRNEDDKYVVKYISNEGYDEEAINNSATLEDAYICCIAKGKKSITGNRI